ncbi:30S ribosomal protein S4 [Candidatus Margulisiibacteriota bacterium]
MGRYTEATCKLCRRNGEKLFLKGERCHTAKCSFTRRSYPPGISGPAAMRRRKTSEYGIRLKEKQKAKWCYGMGERQFRKYFTNSAKQKGMTGTNFMKMLESRLDNFIFRLGLTASRQQARQLIRHGHFKVNENKVDIPSILLKINDTVTIKEKSLPLFTKAIELIAKKKSASWYSFDVVKKEGRFLAYPEKTEIDTPAEEQMIVEFYSR